MRIVAHGSLLTVLAACAGSTDPVARPTATEIATPSLSDAETVWCQSHVGELLSAAAALDLRPAAVTTVSYPLDQFAVDTMGELYNDNLADAMGLSNRLNARQDRWPRYHVLDFAGTSGEPPRVFHWYRTDDYVRPCKAAYEAR